MKKRKALQIGVSVLTGGLLLMTPLSIGSPIFAVHAAEAEVRSLQEAFTLAAQEFGVPERVLLAVSYHMSRWEVHSGKPSTAGGYGPMHLTDLDIPYDGKGENNPLTQLAASYSSHTANTAAELLGISSEEIKQNPVQNIRGASALLAKYAKETAGEVSMNEADWYGAIAAYSGSQLEEVAADFADQVYQTLNEGTERITSDGEHIRLEAKAVQPNRQTMQPLKLQKKSMKGTDCPPSLACDYIPAFYKQTGPNPWNYSNYDVADRPNFGPDIRYIVVHDTEVSYDGTIRLFANPYAASSQYVIRSSDGKVLQMVDNKDVAWHGGNWYFNMHSIGIEHEGYAMKGAAWYSEEMYRSSAKLVRHLAKQYDIPLDRAHIIGHDEVPGLSPAKQSAMHSDPGPFWDWEHYMALMGASITPSTGKGEIVTFRPHFHKNLQEVSDAAPKIQPANFVYLYEAPSFDAPLFNEPALRDPSNKEGLDWGNKAKAGQTFHLAGSEGDWDAIWYAGRKAWFYNPNDAYTVKTSGTVITPKAGKTEIPVYGAAYPEASAYPADITPRAMTPLQYTISQGQLYVAAEKVKSDFYNATVYTQDPYSTHKMIYGQDEYYRIHLNHRFAFVKASDVDVVVQP
ncbi:N-acetylmuramoyl-L-alanine amidase [Ectobacillus sp. JY-23]|uniref:N-acetylmuramoyl-L-alanine amidase n=1 Tax=Ectobacillus sp. JY-23 TaxID=2933872 RepID=UPI001FF6D62F|nr:N-acetylmuramoyl-L-alanine amidase [Ectobacillus sp. JY-23]UOY92535.1 N-acetylmuramoyl-L-alanine amidase [Ectobacillus sp. JY-23]